MIIENMPNGKDYLLFYMKLLVESISHEGNLRFSDTVPYNDQMLATITNTNIDIVRSAIKVFTKLELMQMLEDGTLYMQEIEKMIGCETEWAKKKRNYRLKQEKNKQIEDKTKTLKDNVRQELEKEKELEKELEVDVDKSFQQQPQNLFKYYEQNIGLLAPIIAEGLSHWQDDFEDDIIKKAIDEAVMNNARNYKYINAILNNWLKKGVKVLADIKAIQKNGKKIDANKEVEAFLGDD